MSDVPSDIVVFLVRSLDREPSLRPETLVLLERIKAHLGDYGPGEPPGDWRGGRITPPPS